MEQRTWFYDSTGEDAILRQVEESQQLSTCALVREMNARSSTVYRLLRAEELYPFHYTTVKGLHPSEFHQCIDFCQWLSQQPEADTTFIARVLWTIEAGVTCDGVFISHNRHNCSGSSPHAIRPHRHQDHWSVNVWLGILGNRFIGPFLLPEWLTGHSYLTFLRHVLNDILDDMSLAAIRGLCFLHDGAPAHFSPVEHHWLDIKYAEFRVGVLFYDHHDLQIRPL